MTSIQNLDYTVFCLVLEWPTGLVIEAWLEIGPFNFWTLQDLISVLVQKTKPLVANILSTTFYLLQQVQVRLVNST